MRPAPEPESRADERQKAMHAIARRLCYFRNQDWRYDPGEPKHEHWREKARIILADLDLLDLDDSLPLTDEEYDRIDGHA